MLTNEQQAIVNANFSDILVVEAYAGCGKTSTLVQFCEARKTSKILYLAYNKSMASEAQAKFKHLKNVLVKTMHALAFSEFGASKSERLGQVQFKECENFTSIKNIKNNAIAIKIVNLSIAIYRLFCYSNSSKIKEFLKIVQLNEKDELFLQMHYKAIEKFLKEFSSKIESDKALSYEHDFYLKSYELSKPKLDYDYILVDEAQDLNDCVISIVLQQSAKKVFIGDTYQSIYSFRGASNKLKELSNQANAKTLYLTNSFRCSNAIAKIANKYLKLAGAKRDFVGLNKAEIKDCGKKTYLTRTNAKIFNFIINNQDKKIYVVGGVKELCNDLKDMLYLLTNHKEFIKNSYFKQFVDFKEFCDYAALSENIDMQAKKNLIFKYIRNNLFSLIKDVQNTCVSNEKDSDVIICTAHKSKGLEWDIVELLDDFKSIDTLNSLADEKQRQEELNLFYVASTRARYRLILPKEYIC